MKELVKIIWVWVVLIAKCIECIYLADHGLQAKGSMI